MYERYKSIILKTKNINESDKLCDIFTLERGLITAIFKGVRKKGAKLKHASQPFTFGEFDYVHSKAFRTITSAEVLDTFYDISIDADRFFAACVALEFVSNGLMPDSPNPSLFLSLLGVLKELTYSESNEKTLCLKFLLNGLEDLGFKQNVDSCAICKNTGVLYYDAEGGGILCSVCRTTKSVPMSTLFHNNLRFIANTPFERINTLRLPDIGRLLRIIVESIESLFDTRFKSIVNLRE